MTKTLKHIHSLHQDHLQILSDYPLFALLPNSKTGQMVKATLLSQVVVCEYKKGEIIFLQHSQVDNLYFLLSGRVSCQRELPNGQAYLVANYDNVGLINESVLWDWQKTSGAKMPIPNNIAMKHWALLTHQGGIHQLTATTKKASVVAMLNARSYFDAILDFELGGLIMWFCECISKRLYHHLIGSDLLTFVQAKARLSYYFLTHYAVCESFELPYSQKQLALQIGLRPETFSRALKEMIDLGLISKNKSQYRLIDVGGLIELISK